MLTCQQNSYLCSWSRFEKILCKRSTSRQSVVVPLAFCSSSTNWLRTFFLLPVCNFTRSVRNQEMTMERTSLTTYKDALACHVQGRRPDEMRTLEKLHPWTTLVLSYSVDDIPQTLTTVRYYQRASLSSTRSMLCETISDGLADHLVHSCMGHDAHSLDKSLILTGRRFRSGSG